MDAGLGIFERAAARDHRPPLLIQHLRAHAGIQMTVLYDQMTVLLTDLEHSRTFDWGALCERWASSSARRRATTAPRSLSNTCAPR